VTRSRRVTGDAAGPRRPGRGTSPRAGSVPPRRRRRCAEAPCVASGARPSPQGDRRGGGCMTTRWPGWTLTAVSTLALALGGCCDARLRGVVSDETTGAPIPNALVQSGAVEARSDELGFFDLQGLSCDDVWRVAVSAPGYNLLS